jgi:hypothetical protein
LPDEDINLFIANTEGHLNRAFAKHPRNLVRTDYTIPTEDEQGNPLTDTTPLLPLPTDIASLVSVWQGDTKLEQFPPTAPPACGFVDRGTCLHIYPTPARGTQFFMDYRAFLAPLVNVEDKNWVSSYFSDVYVYGALKESAVYLKSDTRLPLWTQEFMQRVAEVQHQGWEQNLASSPKIRNA